VSRPGYVKTRGIVGQIPLWTWNELRGMQTDPARPPETKAERLERIAGEMRAKYPGIRRRQAAEKRLRTIAARRLQTPLFEDSAILSPNGRARRPVGEAAGAARPSRIPPEPPHAHARRQG